MPGVSETYLTDPDDDNVERALERERQAIAVEDEFRTKRTYNHDDEHREAFRAKLQAWRESKSIPSYGGPRAGRD